MNRRIFLKSAAYAGAFVAGGPLVSNVLDFSYDIILPSSDGEITVTVPRKLVEVQTAYAQFGVNPYAEYLQMMAYQEMLAYEAALVAWQQQVIAYQAQYEWIRQREISAMQAVMARYRNYDVTQPRPWDAIHSIYGVARQPSVMPVMFGINREGDSIRNSKTFPATAAVYNDVLDRSSKKRAEKVAGPQTNDHAAHITLPNGDKLTGNAYETTVGAVGITDMSGFVDRKNGNVGQLVKYKTGRDGEEYMVI